MLKAKTLALEVRMSPSTHVFVYGRDKRLLETRRLVLETLGSEIHAASNPKAADQLIRELKPGVIVLCYTLTSEERDAVLATVQMSCPTAKVLILRADGPVGTQPGEDFNVFAGPAALKNKVGNLLLH